MILRFAKGVLLPLKGGVLVVRHASLRRLAVVPLLLNMLLYAAAVFVFIRFYDAWFGLIMARPEAWYWLIGYYALRILTFLIAIAICIFSFVFVGTVLAAPFLELLSERTETLLRGTRHDQPFRVWRWMADILRSAGQTALNMFLLALAFPLSFIPVFGQAAWLGFGWLLLAYDLSSFALDRRRCSFREKWSVLFSDTAGTLGFGASLFFFMLIPLVGLISLPVAAVAGTLLVLEREGGYDHERGAG